MMSECEPTSGQTLRTPPIETGTMVCVSKDSPTGQDIFISVQNIDRVSRLGSS